MKNIVIKIGSSVLLTKRNRLDEFRISHYADQITALREKGYSVALVISGAVAVGASFVDISNGNAENKRAAAGVGQIYLILKFQEIFVKKNIQLAQILLTKDLFKFIERVRALKNLINFYYSLNIVPIFNENDVVDLNSFGGNDLLSTNLAILIECDQLLILSNMNGSIYGVGGGKTKEEALKTLAKNNISGSIIDGKNKNIILKSIL